ncbi:hypothetical protein A9Q81_17975 [Gammaproteobacteria bacterium 42_54_T18]|nr:hypothetical protein A9Q81_17975 [Gammaproteobacteria bacterium 42_54_T18]
MADKKQISLAVVLMALIALFFWTQSRFPALDTKAQMGQRTSISAIAFDVILPVSQEQPYIERVAKSAINWGYTNWKGMTFGLVFAAAFFTLLRLLPQLPPSRFHIINSLKGMVIGVPLGVCANCSTPIAHGMVKAGTRIETALATLTSSPTLNIFVLSMTFSLLPFHLAIIKLVGVFIFVLLIIPFLVNRFTTQSIDSHIKADNLQKEIPTHPLSNNIEECELPSNNWIQAIKLVSTNFISNLWTIVKATLPLMILAGLLGAIVIESISFTSIAESKSSILALIAVSIIGAFLPVPIAFDIIIVTTLLAAGFPVGLSMALLFSLGIFSIYPAMVVARNVSAKLSMAMFVGVIGVSCISGLVAEQYNQSLILSATNTVSELTLKAEATKQAATPNIQSIAEIQCALLQDPLLEKECVHEASTIPNSSSINKEEIDPLACNNLTVPAEQMRCFSRLTSLFAIKTNKLQQCNPIVLADIKNTCKKTIVLNKIRTLYDIENVQFSLASKNTDTTKGNTEQKTAPHSITTDNIVQNPKALTIKQWKKRHTQDEISISSIDLHPKAQDSTQADQPNITPVFKHVDAASMGISLPANFFLSDFYEPFKYGRGIASGDVNNDNYPDLVFATPAGPILYTNTGGAFLRTSLHLPKSIEKNTFLVSFADINNDGWLDLFFGTYGGKNYVVFNNHSNLESNQQWDINSIIELPNTQTSLTMAAGFIDKDLDGDLDIYLGNWTAGAENNFSTEYSQNAWLINNIGINNTNKQASSETIPFTLLPETGVKGETLSVLFSDFSADNITDLIVTNDNQAPDLYYRNSELIPVNDIIPSTSLTTMSVDTADFNNDLLLDIFTADMSFGEGETPSYCDAIFLTSQKVLCHQNLKSWKSIKRMAPQECNKISGSHEQQQCVIAFIIHIAKVSSDPSICTKIGPQYTNKKLLCQRMATKLAQETLVLTEHIPQIQSNKLMLATESGKFIDATDAFNASASFWSWNSKAADLDNDQWQDIFIANGFGFGEIQNEIHSNVFFHNQKGLHFKESTKEFGLTQYLNTPSYTYLDIDLDGDLDIISTAIMAQPQVYLNQISDTPINYSTGNNISFSLKDYTQNRFCIGCKITIEYGDNSHQIREIKLSGGFLSFDEPVTYFGLGKHKSIRNIQITWSDGKHTKIEKNILAGSRYRIERRANP